MVLEDWQQTLSTFFLHWDNESGCAVGVSHFHLMTVCSFLWNEFLDLFWDLKKNVSKWPHHEHNWCWILLLSRISCERHKIEWAPGSSQGTSYLRSSLLLPFVLWRQRSLGAFGLGLGFFISLRRGQLTVMCVLDLNPGRISQLQIDSSYRVQYLLKWVQQCSALPRSLSGYPYTAWQGWGGKAEQGHGASAPSQSFNTSSCFNKI